MLLNQPLFNYWISSHCLSDSDLLNLSIIKPNQKAKPSQIQQSHRAWRYRSIKTMTLSRSPVSCARIEQKLHASYQNLELIIRHWRQLFGLTRSKVKLLIVRQCQFILYLVRYLDIDRGQLYYEWAAQTLDYFHVDQWSGHLWHNPTAVHAQWHT